MRTWHTWGCPRLTRGTSPIAEWNALMKALHGNGMSEDGRKKAPRKRAIGQAHFATLNVCGGGLESIEGAMEEIQGLRMNVETQICLKWQVLRHQKRC